MEEVPPGEDAVSMSSVVAAADASSSSDPTANPGAGDRPLCVALDGTLIAGDMLWESFFRLVRQRPLDLIRRPVWMAGGRGALKHGIATGVTVDPVGLPFRPEVLELRNREKAAGRRIVLVTATHESLARAVSEHIGL